MNELIHQWTVPEQIDTFQFETTDTDDVDTGFGNYLARIIASNSVKAVNRRSKGAESFFNSPLNEVLFKGNYEDPKKFIRAFSGSNKAQFDKIQSAPEAFKNVINKRALPVMYFYRNLGVYPVDPSEETIQRNVIQDETGKISLLTASISYSVYILATDTSSIDRIANAFVMAFNFDDKSFTSQSSLDGRAFNLDAVIKEHSTIGFDNASLPHESDRLLVYMATVPVHTHIARMHYQDTKDVTWKMYSPTPRY